MTRWRMRILSAVVLTAWATSSQTSARGSVFAQDPGTEEATQLKARVIEAVGSVEHAPTGTDVLDTALWKPVKADMTLGAGTLIRTALRSRCTLMFGEGDDQTVISIRRATLASITQFYQTQTEQRVRLGLGYGAVRGGSSEGRLRSDVIVDSAVATLAKRGTEGFQIEVEPMSGRFRISLARSGLVTARSNATGTQRSVHAGEYATDANIARMWINQDVFDRTVRFYDVEGITGVDLDFMLNEATGLASIAPGAGAGASNLIGTQDGGLDGGPGLALDRDALAQLSTLLIQRPPVHRPEGNFGLGQTFRVLAPGAELARFRSSSDHRIERRASTIRRGHHRGRVSLHRP